MFWVHETLSNPLGKLDPGPRGGLQFPVGRLHRFLRNRNYAERAAAMEYLSSRILELAGNEPRDIKKTGIISRHLQLVIDEELNKLCRSHRCPWWCPPQYPSRSLAQEDRIQLSFT